jgi:hypothetical protein
VIRPDSGLPRLSCWPPFQVLAYGWVRHLPTADLPTKSVPSGEATTEAESARTARDDQCLQNICASGATATACGKGGGACTTCASNETCSSATFTCTPLPCNSSTCPNGCCDATNACRAGTSTSACGGGGLQCAACVGNQTCSTQRVCINNLCSSSTCIGYCDAQGKCQAGSSNAACETKGLNCVACNAVETCCTNHTC